MRMDIKLRGQAVIDAILRSVRENHFLPTDDTKINLLSKEGEPVILEVTELEVDVQRPAPQTDAPRKTPSRPSPEVKKTTGRQAAPSRTSSRDPEDFLFGGQPAWEGAEPHIPDEHGKIAMPDTSKHVEGQLDDNEVVFFDASRFAVQPVPEGEPPEVPGGRMRAYTPPEEDDGIPAQYRSGPSPVEE